VKEVRGRGLIIGIELEQAVEPIRNKILFEHKMFTGVAGKNTIRLLPSLALKQGDADKFLEVLKNVLH
jgi:acetylornithine aminotransferase